MKRWMVLLLVCLVGCAETLEIDPTDTPRAIVATSLPTATSEPIPVATDIPQPTFTPTVLPTSTPQMTPTNTPEPVQPTETPLPEGVVLFDFDTAETSGDWFIVNDGVMGGVSQSNLRVANGMLMFAGIVSLENNGGFASMRSEGGDWETAETTAIRFRAYGDGQMYRFQLYQAGSRWTYEAFFETAAEEWVEITIGYDEFRPTYFGQVVNDAAVDPAKLIGAGVIIQDKQPGEFGLAIDWIRAVRQ